MINYKDIRIASEYNIYTRLCAFDGDLRNIRGVPDVDYDIYGFLDDIRQVIIIPEYSVPFDDSLPPYERLEKYSTGVNKVLTAILQTAKKHGLTCTEDRIEDYGKHFYIVLKGW